MNDLNFKNRLQYYGNNLSRSDQKIADFVLSNTSVAARAPIAELSTLIGTSNSTITRFCQKLHYRNYAEFQTLLLSEKNGKRAPSQLIQKISFYYQSIMESSIEMVDEHVLDHFIQKIQIANRIMICGLGSSGLTAKEFSIRLTRMGVNAFANMDSHLMLAQTSLLTPNDLVIAISNSGETLEIINTCKYAKTRGIPVGLLTQKNHTALTNTGDCILFTSNISQIDDYRYINSQFPLLFLIDSITYGLLDRNVMYRDNYQKTLRALSHHKKIL